ncbi:cobalt ECF transporter T component CbiQ [Heliophilum fasciatum]|uniref:Cobalt/nickel transport system permease protein n=1 Tax=Heliophilum fasciatum TaxID=35700 RepID=A0A4R2RVC2_9FIRM|nr:cobalt ECF transporter T component CbiQ [Heliophilum fasciatum]MCW2278256.1 cobalt/nickel transport system permease protein [Heliophilum fasciatum]TCP63881.1 cobalt/nickel transport system permease protein [Heliophilum fasciatum]
MMLAIDHWAWANAWRDRSPALKTGVTLAALAMAVFSPWPAVPVMIGLATALAVTYGAKIPAKVFWRIWLVPAAFLLVGTVTVAFSLSTAVPDGSVPTEGVWGLPWAPSLQLGPLYLTVTPQGMEQALTLLARAMGATAVSLALMLTTPMVDVLMLLRSWRMPPLVLDLMLLVYRFIFVLFETTESMYRSQEARLGYASWRYGRRSVGILAANLLLRSFLRAQALYVALAARGYHDELRVLPRRRSAG